MLTNQKSDLTFEKSKKIVVINFENYKTLDERNTDDIKVDIEALIKAGHKKIILDLNAVEYFSSVFLGCLAMTFKELEKINGEMRLCNVCEPLRKILRITKMNTFLNVDVDKEDAINGFGS